MTHKVWWSKGPSPGNLGDILTPLILDHFGVKYKYHKNPRAAKVLCVGSIAKFAGAGTVVLGSGTMRESDTLSYLADWRFVRGPRTRKKVMENGGDCPDIYGDPALLMPIIHHPTVFKNGGTGIVPHYVDYEYAMNKYGKDHKVINVLNSNPFEVIDQIVSCSKIVSSSLHGIILAHAYGIPAAWVRFSNKLSGDDTKFADYFESLSLPSTLSSEDSTIFIDPPRKIDLNSISDQFIAMR